jgi:predicted nucleic acid-binding protein
MILVDSSVWIDFFNGARPLGVQRLETLLADPGAPIAVADLVLFEVLRGFRHEQHYLAARRTLGQLTCVEIGGQETALRAAEHYRALRALGRTIRSPIDVLLASYCIDHGHALLHDDRDFDAFEELRGLRAWRH